MQNTAWHSCIPVGLNTIEERRLDDYVARPDFANLDLFVALISTKRS